MNVFDSLGARQQPETNSLKLNQIKSPLIGKAIHYTKATPSTQLIWD